MQRFVIAPCVFALLWQSGSRAPDEKYSPDNQTHSPEFARVFRDANAFIAKGDYAAAELLYQHGLMKAPAVDTYTRSSFLVGIGNARLATQRYAEALQSYADAAELAQRCGSADLQIRIAANRASVYRRMSNNAAAVATLHDVEEVIKKATDPTILLHAARLISDGSLDAALPFYLSAIQAASLRGDVAQESLAWNHLGYAYMRRNRLGEADRALTEAFRIRSLLVPNQLQWTLFYMATVRNRQGDFRSAETLMDRAISLAATPASQIPISGLYAGKAAIQRAAGLKEAAYRSCRLALFAAREWRAQLVAAESFRISGESRLQEIYSECIDTGMDIYRAGGGHRLAEELFLIAAEGRNQLFPQSVRRAKVPPEYLRLLGEYRKALTQALISPSNSTTRAVAGFRVALADLEARLGFETAQDGNSHKKIESLGGPDALHGLQNNLGNDEAAITFTVGAQRSYRWALTRDALFVTALPGRGELEKRTRQFRESIGAGEGQRFGTSLYDSLFGGLPEVVVSKKVWLVSPDGPLFEVPFAGLVTGWSGNKPIYLTAAHAVVVRAGRVTSTGHQEGVTSRFVGLGDGLYNTADPRWKSTKPTGPVYQLVRLPASGREIERCARSWVRDSSPLLMTGTTVSAKSVRNAVALRPAVLHIAAHVIRDPEQDEQVLIALGVRQNGAPDYLSAAEIGTWSYPIGLVTLSGCGSGSGAAPAGVGLFGLTRSWLHAGAQSVVATHWPITDDDGQLLARLYAHLSRQAGEMNTRRVAEALQQAQEEMIANGGWRARPDYWAAFFVAGKE